MSLKMESSQDMSNIYPSSSTRIAENIDDGVNVTDFYSSDWNEKYLPSRRRYDVCFMFPTDPTTGAFSEKSEMIVKTILQNIGKQNTHMYYR